MDQLIYPLSMNKYRKKAEQIVVAVQLDLDTDGLQYQKWGDTQFAKKGDWLVNNNGNIYSIDQAVFERTYQLVGPGQYQKISAIYAEPTNQNGCITTLEGITHYQAGDYLVYENPGQAEGAYAVPKENFEEMYELVVSA